MCPSTNTHGPDRVSCLRDGDACVKNRSDSLIFSKSQSSSHNFNRSYLCEISGSEAPVFHGYIYMTRSVESTSIFSARSAGAGLLRQGTLRDGRPLASQPHTSRINTTLTNLSSSTTSTSTSTNHHHTHNPQDSPTIHHHHLSFSTSHAEK